MKSMNDMLVLALAASVVSGCGIWLSGLISVRRR